MRILDEERNPDPGATPAGRRTGSPGNPYVGELLRRVRSVGEQEDRAQFRDALRRLGFLLAYEISKTMPAREHACRTPLGTRNESVLATDPVLVTILRASLPMWEGMLEVFSRADNVFIGAARREGVVASSSDPALPVDLGYVATPPLAGRTIIYVDPMIATGSTLRLVHDLLVAKAGAPVRTIVAGVIGFRGTIEKLERAPFSAHVFVASADDSLNSKGYIVPGLGDAGDLAFGAKL
jgi:uracil phosphoribosyltransferase